MTYNPFKNYMELKPEPEMKKMLNPARHLLIDRLINLPRYTQGFMGAHMFFIDS